MRRADREDIHPGIYVRVQCHNPTLSLQFFLGSGCKSIDCLYLHDNSEAAKSRLQEIIDKRKEKQAEKEAKARIDLTDLTDLTDLRPTTCAASPPL